MTHIPHAVKGWHDTIPMVARAPILKRLAGVYKVSYTYSPTVLDLLRSDPVVVSLWGKVANKRAVDNLVRAVVLLVPEGNSLRTPKGTKLTRVLEECFASGDDAPHVKGIISRLFEVVDQPTTSTVEVVWSVRRNDILRRGLTSKSCIRPPTNGGNTPNGMYWWDIIHDLHNPHIAVCFVRGAGGCMTHRVTVRTGLIPNTVYIHSVVYSKSGAYNIPLRDLIIEHILTPNKISVCDTPMNKLGYWEV